MPVAPVVHFALTQIALLGAFAADGSLARLSGADVAWIVFASCAGWVIGRTS